MPLLPPTVESHVTVMFSALAAGYRLNRSRPARS
jgi:hypothetical protein